MRILIADGHTLVREGLRSFLEAHGMDVAGMAATGDEALQLAQHLRPDLVLMDLAMPGMGGLEATRLISSQLPDVKVVVLAVAIEQDDLLAAVQAGAWGYVHKDVEPMRFLALLEGVVRGEPALPPELAWKLLGALANPGQEKRIERALHALTAREREVVELLAGGVTSNRDLARRLGVSEHTIKYHLRNVLDKLRLQDRAQVVSYAFRHRLAQRGLLPV
ncbi:MAG TPA: response regulator transcription factor [Ktedonobacterales bacterium]